MFDIERHAYKISFISMPSHLAICMTYANNEKVQFLFSESHHVEMYQYYINKKTDTVNISNRTTSRCFTQIPKASDCFQSTAHADF